MTGLDTNILVRLLTADDPAQHARVLALLRAEAARPGEPPRLLVPAVVFCELVWVLASVYRFDRKSVAGALRGLLDSRDLSVGDRDRVAEALGAYETGKGDFADYYVRASCLAAGCTSVATFDGKLLREPGFRAP